MENLTKEELLEKIKKLESRIRELEFELKEAKKHYVWSPKTSGYIWLYVWRF